MTPQRCRECRGRLGLSLQGMADVLGTDTRLIRRWESGQRPVPPEVAAWLEAAAAVPLPSPSWFERLPLQAHPLDDRAGAKDCP